MSIVYALLDPSDHLVRYVGMTVESADRRRKRHIYTSKRRETHCARWVRSLTKAGLEPEILVLEEVDDPLALPKREIFWIALYRKHGADLTNLSDGGEGTRGPKPEAVRLKISATLTGRKQSPCPPERRQKISAALKGRDNSYAVAQAAKARTGMKLPAEWRAKMSAAHKARNARNGT
jgi:hypothetical protein